MLKFFTQKPNLSLKKESITTVLSGNKSNNEIVQEIHDSFHSEVDKLLADAKISKSLDTDKEALIAKAERLMKLGFLRAQEVADADKEILRIEALKKENESKEKLIEAINYFSVKYPNYKFITEDSVKKICAKYGLIYDRVQEYIGTVPYKNLKHMEDFKIAECDKCIEWLSWQTSAFGRRRRRRQIDAEVRYISGDAYQQYLADKFKDGIQCLPVPINIGPPQEHRALCSLEIAAPVKDFNMDGREVKDFRPVEVEFEDPIVLMPVFHGGNKHFLVVTAWGIEDSDELVVNQKMN